jgi:hypothetical protein
MAGHENRCWRCGVEWAPEAAPPTRLRLIRGGALADGERAPGEGGSFVAAAAAARIDVR